MIIADKISDKRVQLNTKRNISKMSASSGKTDKNEFLTGKQLLPSDQSKIIEQASLHIIYSIKHLKIK